MSMNRRTFILSTGLAAVAPAFGAVLATAPDAGSAISPGAAGFQPDLPVTQAAEYDLPFKITGWEPREEMAADERMWISIGQSWRAAWR